MVIPLKILLIEDSEDDAFLLLRELKLRGYDPVHLRVETSADMQTAIKEERWDIIISDFVMPRFSGLSALALLKQSSIDIPFIIVSGKMGEETAVEAMKAGAHDYILKDNLSRLVPAIERELREAEMRAGRRVAEEELKRHREHLEELVRERTTELSHTNERLQQEVSDRKLAEDALKKAIKKAVEEKAKSEAIIAALGDGVVILGDDYKVTYQNVIHKDLIGDFVGELCFKAYCLGKSPRAECPVFRSFQDGGIHKAERTITSTKGPVDIEITASPLRDASGKIMAAIELVRDITARKKMEDELREHRDHLDLMVKERTTELRALNKELRAEIMRRIQMEKDLIESQRFVHRIADATPNILYLFDVIENKNIYVNSRIKEILGYSPEQIKKMKGAFFKKLLHPGDEAVYESLWKRFVGASDGDIIESEYRLKNCDGQWRWFYSRDIVFKRTADGLLKLVLGISQDITERKIVEEELKSSRAQLRRLLAHLQSVREDERTRISREVHDELGQALTALKMDIVWLLKRLDKDQESLLQKANSMLKLVDMNIQTVKRIASELRPGLLDDLGLTAAIEWQAEEFRKRTGIRCEVSIRQDDIEIDRDISTAIFRIFQETLTNVVRHAMAKKVRVDLKKNQNTIVIQVKDDGVGISEKDISSPRSIGLIGMRERVHFFGGRMEIRGDNGTTVKVSIPLADKADAVYAQKVTETGGRKAGKFIMEGKT